MVEFQEDLPGRFNCAHRSLGFLAIACTLIVSLSFNATTAFILSRRYATFRLRFDFAYWREFLRNSLPMGITAIITFTYFKMDTILLSVLQSNAHVGIYNVAYKIMENLIFFQLCWTDSPLLSRYIFTQQARLKKLPTRRSGFHPYCRLCWHLVPAPDIIAIVSGTEFRIVSVLRIIILPWPIFFGSYFNMLWWGNAQKLMLH
jgi:hypothetical protein